MLAERNINDVAETEVLVAYWEEKQQKLMKSQSFIKKKKRKTTMYFYSLKPVSLITAKSSIIRSFCCNILKVFNDIFYEFSIC